MSRRRRNHQTTARARRREMTSCSTPSVPRIKASISSLQVILKPKPPQKRYLMQNRSPNRHQTPSCNYRVIHHRPATTPRRRNCFIQRIRRETEQVSASCRPRTQRLRMQRTQPMSRNRLRASSLNLPPPDPKREIHERNSSIRRPPRGRRGLLFYGRRVIRVLLNLLAR